MSFQKDQKVAIIGAGLAGMSLALALHKQSIPCTIYELRDSASHLTATGALMLCPNALKVLSEIGVYERIKNQGYMFEKLEYKDENYKITDEYYLGGEKLFGYKALRVYRDILLRETLGAITERGIQVQYGRKFSKVVKEDETGVEFAFEDGSTESATLLIGADGIHSKVRQYIHPNVGPIFSGMMAITSVVHVSDLRFPEPNYHLTTSIHSKYGAFVFAPQNSSGTEILVGTQMRMPEQDQEGWRRIRQNKDELKSMFQAHMNEWPDLVQSAMEHMNPDKLSIWPYYVVPKLDTWSSPGKRVIILGDAAHAIPPTAGQGASQAFEDVYSLSLLLSKLSDKVKLDDALDFWQCYRMARVDDVLALTRKLDVKRLPTEDKAKVPEEVVWLFEPKIEEKMLKWVAEQENQ
ncbi:kynurenine 3-monooxygenase [Mollisia scopiformis]|uniref:Kynurenine 3-monooxygenase n=1 Tax=Mollisia scopiformis TaxID=149040 RepID=A0A132B997_MOLSC|nr:kynurenine 3-monooxygenase [Mollisia scopiformis]KUJ08978.1 kynurenine 3-monooxygenase [Mollisia scopiformis]